MGVVGRRHTSPRCTRTTAPEWSVDNDVEVPVRVPPAPWTFRREWPREGAPRYLRSQYLDFVRIGTTDVGVFDWLYQTYSHWGVSESSVLVRVNDEWEILYDFDAEWSVVMDRAFWIEFVSDTRERVARISREDAIRFGDKMEYEGRAVWAVPMKHYETHGRSS